MLIDCSALRYVFVKLLTQIRLKHIASKFVNADHFCPYFSQLAFNTIPLILKSHFQNCPLAGFILLNNNDIGYIEDGTFEHVTELTYLYVDFT